MEAIAAMRWTGLSFRKLGWSLLLGVVAATATGKAQGVPITEAAYAPQTSLTEELGSLASRAGTIFVGQVISIERRAGVVEVGFSIEQIVVGGAGGSYTLREWAGLWPQGQSRYTLGERALIFLHAPSAAGFASPVDGAEGVLPVIVQGANAPQLLDIRRVAAALLRAPGTPLPTETEGAILLSEATSIVAEMRSTPDVADAYGSIRHRQLKAPVRFPVPIRGRAAQAPDINETPLLEPRPTGRPLTMSGNDAVSGNGSGYVQQ